MHGVSSLWVLVASEKIEVGHSFHWYRVVKRLILCMHVYFFPHLVHTDQQKLTTQGFLSEYLGFMSMGTF